MFVFKVKNFLSIIFILILSVSFIGSGIYSYSEKSFIEFSGDFCWPLNGYTYISSKFGYRSSPTSGASTYHSGIDIPAPEGTPIYSVTSGIVTFCSWGAGGGYTVVIENETYKISYCHVSPVMIVKLKEEVKAGEQIANVGPKNVYGITNNPYKDSNGNPTNGATTGCHLHLSIRKDR